MADLNDIENIAGTVISYSLFNRLVNRYGLLNVLFYGALIVTIIVFFFIWCIGQLDNAGYQETWDKVKKGDKLYFNYTPGDTILTKYRPEKLVRPINKEDILKMHIADWKKTKMIAELDTTLKPLLIDAKEGFTVDSMYKYKTAYIGDFIKKDTLKNLNIEDSAEGMYIYTFKFNISHAQCCYPMKIPKGYVIADENYYIRAGIVRLQESAAFLNIKK